MHIHRTVAEKIKCRQSKLKSVESSKDQIDKHVFLILLMYNKSLPSFHTLSFRTSSHSDTTLSYSSLDLGVSNFPANQQVEVDGLRFCSYHSFCFIYFLMIQLLICTLFLAFSDF